MLSKIINQRILIILFVLVICYVLFNSNVHKKTYTIIKKTINIYNPPDRCKAYRDECLALYKKLRNPEMSMLHDPPIKKIPDHLVKEFLKGGNMKLVYHYRNDRSYHKDASADSKDKYTPLTFKQMVNISSVMKGIKKVGPYGDAHIGPVLSSYSQLIKDRTMLIVGTIDPWLEKMSYYLNATKITTLDYTRAKWDDPKLEWLHVNDYLDDKISKQEFEIYDNSISFSSIEHSGLGRYGDPISPNGDVDAVRQVHCSLKTGGLFFLGLPYTDTENGTLVFNLHRIYGKKRIEFISKGWTLMKKLTGIGHNSIFVMKKDSEGC